MIILPQTRSLLACNDELSLDAQFANDKSYSIDSNAPSGFLVHSRVGPSFKFTRASSATEINSKGVIVKSNENLSYYSSALVVNVGWVATGTTSILDGTSPIGTDAYMLSETTANSFHNFASSGSETNAGGFTANIGEYYTYSVFLKKVSGSINWIQLTLGTGAFGTTQFVNFNLGSGTIGNSAGGAVGKIEAYPDEWYRCSITAITTSTAGSVICSIGFINNTNSTIRLPVYVGNTANRVLAASGQFQSGTLVDSYILTTSAIRYAPRFQHDPVTLESLGLLKEDSRTNFCRYSGQVRNNIGWGGNALAAVTASGIGPDGNSSYRITESTSSVLQTAANTGGVTGSAATSVTAGTTYTGSLFVKKTTGSPDWIQLTLGSDGFGTAQYANFNLTTGSIGNYSGLTANTVPRIESFADGWYRCSITATATTTTTSSNNIIIAFVNNTDIASRLPTYAGNTSVALLITMAQFEIGDCTTSYIPTTTTSVVRSADVCTIVGDDFSSFYNSDEGTFITEVSPVGFSTVDNDIFRVTSSGSTNLRLYNKASDDNKLSTEITGAGSITPLSGYNVIGESYKTAVSYDSTGLDYIIDGTQIPETSTTTTTVGDSLSFDSDIGSASNAVIGSLRYYRKRHSVPKLQSLTTEIFDADALSYIERVEAADGQPLEYSTRVALNNFIVGCKSDGLWDSINSSCILACARTLAGALVPLKGSAPINYNFTAEDYNRQIGLVGDGSTKYLDSGYNVNTDPQDDCHQAVYVSTISQTGAYIGAGATATGSTQINVVGADTTGIAWRHRNSVGATVTRNNIPGLIGHSRSNSTQITTRANSTTSTVSLISETPFDGNAYIFARLSGTAGLFSFGRMTFYSMGRNIDLGKLDDRVKTLMNQFSIGIDSYVFDADAIDYIQKVEAADKQTLEYETRLAINDFIVGCKADGLWDSINSSCVLAGARTLAGALVPLKGIAPTNFNFVSEDYNRKTGLIGNGSTKYLDSNRNNNADPQNSKHVAVYVTQEAIATTAAASYIGTGSNLTGDTGLLDSAIDLRIGHRVHSAAFNFTDGVPTALGLLGLSRYSDLNYTLRAASTDYTVTQASELPSNRDIFVFARGETGSIVDYSNGRISFYSIGTDIDLTKLETRLSTFMSQITSIVNNANDPDLVSFVSDTGAADTNVLGELVEYVKGQGLWNNFVIYPLKSAQNYGSGSTVRGLGGLTTNSMTLYNSPTWSVDGLVFNSTTQYGRISDFLGSGDIVAAVRRSGAIAANGTSWSQYDVTLNDRSWGFLESGSGVNMIALNRSSDGTFNAPVSDGYNSTTNSYVTTDAQYIASWIGPSVSLWRDKTRLNTTLASGTVQSGRYNSSSDITLNCRLGNNLPEFFAGGTYSAAWICTKNLTTVQRETITDIVNLL